jgi:hypothetical protein
MDEPALRHQVRSEIVRNSGDTTWITDAVIRAYTAGQVGDLNGSIDAFQRMSKSKEPTSLADRLHECTMPVRLLVGTAPHPSAVTKDQQALLSSTLGNFATDSVAGSGQFIHEEQPAVVLAAVARLDEAAAQSWARAPTAR